MKNMKKIIAVLMSLTAITMTTSAFAATGNGTATYVDANKAVSLSTEDLKSATGQLTVVIVPYNLGADAITSENIYYINQAEAGDGVGKFNDIIKAMKVKTVTDENGDEIEFAATNYEVRIGGALPNDYYVYKITGEELEEIIDWGNVDGEGGITATDADWILRKVVNSTLVLANEVAANVDGEGGITATDADWILRKVVNSQLSFPAAAK